MTPGLWFLGPYSRIDQEAHPQKYYQACSTGPTIYDGNGDLIWSGACVVENQNTCDFRPFTDTKGNEYLSMIIHGYSNNIKKKGLIMDSTYNLATARNTTPPPMESGFNMHEYKIIDQGRSALYITFESSRVDVTDLNIDGVTAGWVSNVGFREVDVDTNDVKFEWWSLGKISPSESVVEVDTDHLRGPWPKAWSWFHPNSVDKSDEGDYIMSGRFVDGKPEFRTYPKFEQIRVLTCCLALYKISGKDGSIMWRLGGKLSDFDMDFNFSKQHDAQFMGRDPTTGAEIISFFDNAKAIQKGGIDTEPTADSSSGLVVALDTNNWTARVLRRIERPDGGLTPMRGNFQLLPNGNAVGGWSDNGYVSEHGPDGRLLFEARFASERLVNYRAYKYNFTGHPTEPPALKAFVYGETPETSTTAWYVSWNGATEVAKWRFCRGTYSKEIPANVVGTTLKIGFETVFHSDGAEGPVYVEAIAKNASVIGRSEIQQAVLPFEWEAQGSSQNVTHQYPASKTMDVEPMPIEAIEALHVEMNRMKTEL